VLPIANVAEEEGSFVNRSLRVQKYAQAKPAPGMARPAWWVLGELAASIGQGDAPTSAAAAFDQLAAGVEAFSGMSYRSLGANGQIVNRIPVIAP
jgi:predicted molibdopterin-dependent oxidoreductase YjgC